MSNLNLFEEQHGRQSFLRLDEFHVGEDVVEESGLAVLPPLHGLLEGLHFHVGSVAYSMELDSY